MYRDDRALEERVEHLEARLAEVQDELRAARADAPKTRKRALEAMALTHREIEARLEVVAARLEELRSDLDALAAEPQPSAKAQELRAEREELELEYRTLRRVVEPGHGEPQTLEKIARKRRAEIEAAQDQLFGRKKKPRPKRPFWVTAFWFVLHFLGAAAGGAAADMDDIPSTRATLLIILSLLALAGIITLAIVL